MQLTNDWYYFINAVNPEDCKKIISMGDESWNESSIDTNSYITDEERKVGKKPTYKKNCKIRESSVAWSNEQWLYDLIWPYMAEANELSGWRFDISSAETMQITRYEKNGFYLSLIHI